MNKKILVSLMVIGIIGAVTAGSTTFAEFTDTETSAENVFQGGTLDLQLGWNSSYSGAEVVEYEDTLFGSDQGAIWTLNDVKPGDTGEATLFLRVNGNPSWVQMNLSVTENDENGTVEPELAAGDVADNTSDEFDGELWQNLEFTAWYDNGAGEEGVRGDNQKQPEEPLLTTTSQTCTSGKVDVALVMDRSGSMEDEPGKFQAAKDGGKTLIDNLSTGDQSAAVSFSSSATIDQELTMNKTAVKNAIDSLNSVGGTNIEAGIDEATTELTSQRARAEAQKVMVVISDGKQSGGDPVGAADDARAEDIRVITIAYGSDADQTQLQNIANEGDFYNADQEDIKQVFSDIGGELCESTSQELTEGMIVDADPSTAEPDRFEANETRYIGFKWELPYDTGNEVMTDTSKFDLNFEAVQERHTSTP